MLAHDLEILDMVIFMCLFDDKCVTSFKHYLKNLAWNGSPYLEMLLYLKVKTDLI